MKALTLWQPWATLIAIGAKPYETRSWKTAYRGPLIIHAARRLTRLDRQNCQTEPFRGRLLAQGFETPDDLPRGAAVAVGDLITVAPTEVLRTTLTQDELPFGDYRDNRYAWKLANVHRFSEPIPARGSQGLWNWPLQTLYTFGYGDTGSETLHRLRDDLDALVVDIRFNPRSRLAHWNAGPLQRLFGDHYEHLPALGNLNYRAGGPVEFMDLTMGIHRLLELLLVKPVILLCACSDYQVCHRLPAAQAVVERFGAVVVHL
jgi:hypothetical protein